MLVGLADRRSGRRKLPWFSVVFPCRAGRERNDDHRGFAADAPGCRAGEGTRHRGSVQANDGWLTATLPAVVCDRLRFVDPGLCTAPVVADATGTGNATDAGILRRPMPLCTVHTDMHRA